MNLSLLETLACRWRDEAAVLRRRGVESQALLLEGVAGELEEGLQEWRLELLTLEEVGQELGLAYDTVQRRVSRGELKNSGRPGAPRVRRCDLRGGAPDPTDSLADEILRERRKAG